MKIDVILFATLKDIAGRSRFSITVDGDGATVNDVRRELVVLYPELAANAEVAIAAVNAEFAFAADSVVDGDEVAFFPPVSGGAAEAYPEIFRLAPEPVNVDELTAAITIPATGAICVFSGMVRGETDREGHLGSTVRLEYEAYESMALAKMRQVAVEIRRQWPLVQGIAVVQRVGVLEVGQNTILIACASGHRDQGCFEAARYGIDRLKEIVPVWKKEVGQDGSVWVEGQYVPTAADRQSAGEHSADAEPVAK